MTSRPTLTAQAAELTTATVQIQKLVVNRKQVTLAVFRQLYEERLYDWRTWKPAGTPWCRVNHHPDKCSDASTHEHVVWQKGNELRRDRISVATTHPWWHFPNFGFVDDEVLCLAAVGIAGVKGEDARRTHRTPEGVDVSVSIDLGDSDGTATLCVRDPATATLIYRLLRDPQRTSKNAATSGTLRFIRTGACVPWRAASSSNAPASAPRGPPWRNSDGLRSSS